MKKDKDMSVREKQPKKRDDAYAVSSGDAYGKVRNNGIWKRFFHTCAVSKLPWGALTFYIVLTALQSFIFVKVPQINGNFFAGDASVRSVSMFIGVELFITVFCQFLLYINFYIRGKMNRNLRNVLWQKILKLKPKYFDRVSSSTLISRITNDAESMNEFVMDIVLGLAFQVYVLVLSIMEMSALSIKAGLMLLAFVPLSVIYSFFMGRFSLKLQSSAKSKMSDLTAYLSELIACLPLIKAFNRQSYEEKRGKRVIDEYFKAEGRVIFLDFLKQVLGTIVGIGPDICIILIGVKMLTENSVNAAGWYIFYTYAGTFIVFFNSLGSMWENAKATQGRLNRVSDILYEEDECVEPYVSGIISDGDIIFDDVSFGYDDTSVLENISMTIPGGKTTAIVGYSGSGKSTILKLLEKIYEPQEGRVLVGGKANVHTWRENIAFVTQNTPLMSGTIRENILYGIRREVSDEEIMAAAKSAYADGFIRSCSEGLDYEVGQFGARLSGGQRQKISLTRAILCRASYLILDEPTASLDIISTDEVIKTVDELSGKLTVILVTHNGKAVSHADHVIVVDKDHTVTEGSPDELKKTNDFYGRLVKA